ncbi:MAG TPA: DUF1634 domain-containing protein [Candidatus Limnocylindrales bacterium]
MSDVDRSTEHGLEASVGRLVTAGTYLSIAILAAGVVAMLVAGISPLGTAAPLDLPRLAGELAALRPEGFLWLGLLAVIATPSARVVAALVGFARRRERRMAGIAILVLVVIVVGVIVARPQP